MDYTVKHKEKTLVISSRNYVIPPINEEPLENKARAVLAAERLLKKLKNTSVEKESHHYER